MKHRIKNYSFQIFIVFICIQLGMSQVNASGFIRLYDATVTGQNVSLNNSSNNQNEVNETVSIGDTNQRESLFFETAKENIEDDLKEQGYKEDISKRTENSKTLSYDGIEQTIIYNEPVYYKKNNQLREYDNDFVKSKVRSSYTVYQNKSGDHHYQIPETLNQDSHIIIDNIELSLNHIEETQGEIKENTAYYHNAEDQKDYGITAYNTGMKIKSAISDKQHSLTQSYSLHLPEDYTVQLTDDHTAAYIYQEDKPMQVISAGCLKDADGNVIDLYDLELQLNEKELVIAPTQEKMKQLTTAPYSMEVSVKTVTNPDYSLIKLYGVRSGDKYKDKSYAPEVNSNYAHFAMVGRDPQGSINEGTPSPENVGLIKVDFNALVNKYIGEYRRIESASMSLRLATTIKNKSTLSMSRLNEKMPLFDNYNNLKWTKYESYFQKYKDRNQEYSPVRLDTKTVTRKPGTVQFISFNITDAIDDWYQGNPAHGLILEGDSADTKAQAIFNHASSNDLEVLPYMTVSHVQDGPINPNLSLDDTTLQMRPFTQSNGQGLLHFTALGFDGLSRPDSDVQIQVVDTVNQKVVYNQTTNAASTYRIFPLYDKIANAQQYYRKVSNYQMNERLLSSSLENNHLYQIKYKVTAYDKNGNVQATKNWTNSETFQLYKVGGFDRISRIIDFYGIKNTSQLRLDNHMFDSLLVQENLLFLRNPTKNQNKAYSSQTLTVNDKKAIDMALMGRGLHCEYGYEPVNYNTGNLYYNNQDAYFVEYGEKYYFERSYNSLAEKSGVYGNNWDLNWNYQLSFANNAALFSDGTGKILTFFKNGNSYQSPDGYQMTMKQEKVDEKIYYVDSGYYDQEETPVQEKVVVPIYDYIITDVSTHKVYRFNDEGYIQEVILDEYGHKMVYSYDSSYNVKQMKSSSGKVFTFTYNENHYLVSIQLPNYTKIQYDYDSQGNMIGFTDQKGYKIHYAYQGKGLLKTYTSRESNHIILTNEFDSLGRVIKQTDAKNQTVTFQYNSSYTKINGYDGKSEYVYLDSEKRTTKKVNQDGQVSSHTYNSDNQLTSTVEDGQKTQFIYNNQGQLVNEVRSDGKKSTYTYSGNNIIQKTDFDGKTTKYEYDSYGHVTKTINPDGTYTANRYNADGQMIYERDIHGLEKTYTYDKGNKVKETDQNGYTIQYTYDALGMINSQTDQENYKTEFVRDQRGQKIKEISPTSTKHYSYDGDGNLVYEEDGNGHGIYYKYDELSRLIEKKDAYGTVKTEYDVNGNIIQTTDELGFTKSYTYDALKNKTSYTNEEGYSEYYKYDDKNQLIETQDIKGISTYHTYNSLGQIIKEQRLDKINTYQYNDQGQLTEKNENGIITTFQYDQYGNISFKETNGMKEEYEYFYDQLLSQTIKGAKTTYDYDIYGRKIKETNALGDSTTYLYSPSGNLIQTTQPNGNIYTMTYDGDHHLLSTTDSLGNKTSAEYDANGNVIRSYDENGNVTTYTYTARNQKASMKDPLGNVYTYTYNAKGQLIKTADPLCNESITSYTPLGNVSQTTDSIGRSVETFYDEAGQVIEIKDVRGRSATQVYDDYHRLISSTNIYGKETRYTYDKFDRVIKTEDDYGHIKEMTYNDLGLPITETNEKDQKIIYEYNQYGYLIKTTDIRGNETTSQFNVLGQVISQTDERGIKTILTYDQVGNVLTKTTDKITTIYQYNQIGLLESETDHLGRTKSYQYDAKGNVIETKNALGYKTKNIYDANNNLIATINEKNQKTSFEYDALNRPFKQINPDLTFTLNAYDQVGRVIESTNELGYQQKVEYNDLDQEVAVIDAKGNQTTYEYNDQDLLSRTVYPNGSSTANIYDEKGQLIESLDVQANRYQYEYDKYGRKTKETSPNGYFKEYIYNAYDDVVQWNDNDGVLLTYEYNQYGQQISATNRAQQTSKTIYDALGRVQEEVDIRGNSSYIEYDVMNRMTRQTDVRGNITTYTYDELDRVTETRVNEKVTQQVYDCLGNVIKDIDALGYETSYEFDERNQLIKEINALGQETRYTYDATGHVLTVTNAKNQVKEYGYDELGQKTKEINEAGEERLYHYNHMGQVESIQTEDQKIIQYQFDISGNMIKIAVNKQDKYQFKYDNMNQLTEQKDAKQNTEFYTYDIRGNIKSYTDKNGTAIHYEYTPTNQLKRLYCDTIENEYQYDKYGQLIRAYRNTQKEASTFKYNQYGDIIEVTDPNDQSVQYTYDGYGRQFKVYYPSGQKVSYKYDDLDHVIEVKDGKQTTHYTYDALGREILEESLLQKKETTYNEIGQIIESKTNLKDKQISYQYEYDSLGNTRKEISNINGQKQTKEMAYDKAGQLITSRIAAGDDIRVSSYTYDESGNRILYEETVNGEKTIKHSSYNANDELMEDGKAIYRHDKQGNVIEKIYEDGHKEKMFYNDFNELVLMKSTNGKKIRYGYDALGNRISKEEKAPIDSKDFINYLKTDVKIPDLDKMITSYEELDEVLDRKKAEYQDAFSHELPNQTSTWLTSEGIDVKTFYVNDITYEHTQVLELQQNKQVETYTYGNNRISMTIDDLSMNYIYDGKGNVISDDGLDKHIFTYDDFGKSLENINDSYAYRGENTEYNYQYLRARYYETANGRFLSRDNYLGERNASEYNQYIYALNNPSMYKDPSGHFSISAIADIMISSTKKLAQDHIDKGAELLSKGLDWMGKITGMKGATNVVKKEVNKAAKKTKKIVDEVTRNVKKAAAAVDKKKQQQQQKNSFIEYAKQHGIDEAYRKFKNMDGSLLEEAVKAYCDTLGLEYTSVKDALKSISKVEKGLSLLSKYTTICETIKHAGNVNESAVQSSVGYSSESSMHKVYLGKAIEVLSDTRAQACNFPGSNINVSAKINTIYNYPYGTKELTNEYASSMNSHCNDMIRHIWTSPEEYKAVRVWVGTGTYSGGRWEDAVYHVGSKQYHAYGNWLYTTFVPWGAEIQEHAELLEFLTTIAGEANQSYNPYTGASTVTGKDSIKGPSSTNGGESTNHANSSIGNSSVGDIGNTTSSGGHGSTGNSTSKGYASSGNTSPGYAPPSSSNSGYQGASGARTSLKNASSSVGSKLNGTVSELNNGYKIEIPNGNKPIVVRIMDEGSGGRSAPYFRVSIDGKGSLTLDGVLSSDRALTHIDLTDNYLEQITNMVTKYKGGK